MSNKSDKVQLGVTQSSFKTVDNLKGTIEAGKVVHQKSDGTISLVAADGVPLGVSLGKDLSDIGRTSICRRGIAVPIVLTTGLNPVVGAQVNIDDTLGIAKAAGAGATGVNAVYASGRVGGSGVNSGIDEDGNAVGVALIDFPGGL